MGAILSQVRMWRFSTRWMLLSIGLIVVYVIAGRFGLRLAFLYPSATPIWPPAGIAVAALLILGNRYWPAVFLGALVVNLTTAGSLETSLAIAFGNTLEALAGAALARRFAQGREAVRQARGILAFTLAAALATTLSPTIGLTGLAGAGFASWSRYGAIWLTWWLGDLGGVLVVAPAILLWYDEPRVRWTRPQSVELAILLLLLLGTSELVFSGPIPVRLGSYPVEYVFLPILLWMAFRLSTREAASALLLLAAMAIDGTLRGVGPFVRATPNESLLVLQGFMGVASVTTLAFGALVRQRRLVEAQLRHLSISDPLTGLGNYRHLMAVLQGEIRRSDRTGRPFAVVFLDVDRLKTINDRYGHMVGSRALCRVAEVLRRSCRAVDTAARYGGDEFAIVLPEAGEPAAQHVGLRVQARLEIDSERPPVTVSLGIAIYPRDGTTVEALVGWADRILYEMKARNAGAGGMFGGSKEPP